MDFTPGWHTSVVRASTYINKTCSAMLAELTKAKFKKSTFFEFWYFVLVFLVIALFDSAAFEFFFSYARRGLVGLSCHPLAILFPI